MNRFLTLVAAILSMAFVVSLALVLPLDTWTPLRSTAAFLVLSSIWLYVITGSRRSTDVALGSLGILGGLCFLHFVASIWIFYQAITVGARVIWVFCVAGFAAFPLIVMAVNAAAKIIGDNIDRNDTPGEFPKIAGALANLSLETSDESLKTDLLRLSDELRYFPRVLAQDGWPLAECGQHLAALTQQVAAGSLDGARIELAALRRELERLRADVQRRYSKV
jgi:hypothetical protein